MKHKGIDISLQDVTLIGRLRIVDRQKGLIIFSHGSGSIRLSSRINYIADGLKEVGFSSLLYDLLTETEDLDYANRFNIELLWEAMMIL